MLDVLAFFENKKFSFVVSLFSIEEIVIFLKILREKKIVVKRQKIC
jgi:hypothetical protein